MHLYLMGLLRAQSSSVHCESAVLGTGTINCNLNVCVQNHLGLVLEP